MVHAFHRSEAALSVVDVLVNNAGIAHTAPFAEMTEAQWDSALDVNLKDVWRVGHEAAKRLIATNKPGSIVNVSSVMGFGVLPAHSGYVTSKAACIQLSRSMAVDLWSHGIRVNALAPGFYQTELNDEFFTTEAGKSYLKRLPARRLGKLRELDGPWLLLASDAGSFMSGAVIPVDAAHSVRLL